MLCILCQTTELTFDTKPEHVLLNALGGRKTTKSALCSECNERCGRSVDNELAQQVSTLRNMLRVHSGDGSPPPMRRNVTAGNQRLNIHGDGTMEVLKRPFNVEEVDGVVKISISVNSEEELRRMLPHIAAKARITEAKLRGILADGDATLTHTRADTIFNSTSFGGPEALRSMTKACLALWATHVGNEELHRESYNDARNYVRFGSEHFNFSRTELDSRLIPYDEELQRTYSPIYNMIYVSSDSNGRVVGYFCLYNMVGWSIVLAEQGGKPDKAIGLAVNPVNPTIWSDDIAQMFPISNDWLDKPDYPSDFTRALQRMNSLMKFYVDSGREREVKAIINDYISKNGIDDALSEEQAMYLSQRISYYLLSMPFSEKIDMLDLIKD